MRRYKHTEEQQVAAFFAKIRRELVVPELGMCWVWTAGKLARGYGLFRRTLAHRWSYEHASGDPLPLGYAHHIDHLCRNESCVRPSHLERVTARENALRAPTSAQSINLAKTHCIRGHDFNQENTHVRASGKRRCRVCDRESKVEKKLALTGTDRSGGK